MDHYLEIIGHGQAAGVPDRAVVAMRAEATGVDVATALSLTGSAATAIVETARTAGVADSLIRTEHVALGPHWSPEGTQQGYLASQSVRVALDEVGAVGQLVSVSAAAAGDAFRLDGLEWSHRDPETLMAQARQAAWLDARDQAVQLARLSGRGLGSVLSIVDSSGSGYRPMPRMMAAKSDTLALPPGEEAVSAVFTIRWELVDPAAG